MHGATIKITQVVLFDYNNPFLLVTHTTGKTHIKDGLHDDCSVERTADGML